MSTYLSLPQDWQLKLSGIDLEGDTEETDIDGEEDLSRMPVGAINPLLVGGIDGKGQ